MAATVAFTTGAVRPMALTKAAGSAQVAKAVFVSNATVKKTTAMQVCGVLGVSRLRCGALP